MTEPTWREITEEAIRRKIEALDDGQGSIELERLIVEVVREGWKPPKPVDPDVLAFRAWVKQHPETSDWYQSNLDAGVGDKSMACEAFLAGARYARGEKA